MTIEQARTNMLKQQVRASGVLDDTVLQLLQTTPRELFVPSTYQALAFADMAIPLGHQQVMFTPTEEGLLLQALQLQAHHKVLEIGTGSGYFTALLARQAAQVESIDIFPDFTLAAQQRLAKLHIRNAHCRTADATQSCDMALSYDAIIIGGSLPFLATHWQESLKIGGRLVAIIGQAPAMHAICLTRIQHDEWQRQDLFETVVPELINAVHPDKFIF